MYGKKAELMASRLKADGWLYYITDWEEYAEATLDVLSAEQSLSNAYDSGPGGRAAIKRPAGRKVWPLLPIAKRRTR